MAAMRTGKVMTTIRQVTSIVQQKTGSRSMVIPGARRRRMVASVAAANSSPPVVAKTTPKRNMSMPVPGVLIASDSGT